MPYPCSRLYQMMVPSIRCKIIWSFKMNDLNNSIAAMVDEHEYLIDKKMIMWKIMEIQLLRLSHEAEFMKVNPLSIHFLDSLFLENK
jgi:hypothetical protein